MEETKYIWKNKVMVPWKEANVHVLTHTLHYGGGAFEGIRCYKTEKGSAIFRLKEHIARLFYSARAIGMNAPYTEDEIIGACVKAVKENNIDACYIRPLIYYGYGKMGLSPAGAPVDIIVACWPWDAYLGSDMVRVKTSKYIRIHPKSTVADAKICGNYANSILASLEAKGAGYDEALFLDANGNAAEGPGENIFIVKNRELFTPPPGAILKGITRDAVMQISGKLSISCREKIITPKDIFSADEAFFTGTAAEVCPIKSLDDKIIGDGKIGPITQKIKDAFTNIIKGKDPCFERFLTYVH